MRCSTVALLLCSAPLALGALPGAHAQTSARLTGRVLDATGRPSSAAVIRLVSDPAGPRVAHPMRYVTTGDLLGKFSQEGVAPGAYLVMVFTGGKQTDVLRRIRLLPGASEEIALTIGTAGPQIAWTGAPTGEPTRMLVQTR